MRRSLSVLLLLAAPAAHAGPVLGLDGGYALPVDDAPYVAGPGLGGRVGLGFDLQVVELVPEVGVAWYGAVLPQAGARVVFGQRTRPGLWAHAVLPLGGDAPTLGADAGLSLDLGAPRTVGVTLYAGGVTPQVHDPLAGASLLAGAGLTLRL